MKYLIGIDLGTTALKGIIINSSGKIISTGQLQTNYQIGNNGFVEFSAEKYYDNFCLLINNLISKLPQNTEVTAMSISGASGNTLLLDENKRPISNVISWLDKREDLYSMVFGEIPAKNIYEITGWPYFGIFPLAHLSWLKVKDKSVYKSASHVVLNISYIYYRLTGKITIDHSTATTFYLQNQERRRWHHPFLNRLHITEQMLPELKPSSTKLGDILEYAARETGLSKNTAVVLGSFDHPAAARGTGVLSHGSMLLSCGTSWVGFYPIKERKTGIENKMLIDPFLSPKGNWGAMFSIPGIGKTIDAIIDYLIDGKTMGEKYNTFNNLAEQSDSGANGIFINIISSINKLKDTIDNLLKTTELSDILRALMESIAFEVKRNIIQHEKHNNYATDITMVGGASKSLLWTQIISDVTGRNIRLLNGQHAGALGSAIMAGIGEGIFVDEKDGFNKVGGTPQIIKPNNLNKKLYQKNFKRYEFQKNITNDK